MTFEHDRDSSPWYRRPPRDELSGGGSPHGDPFHDHPSYEGPSQDRPQRADPSHLARTDDDYAADDYAADDDPAYSTSSEFVMSSDDLEEGDLRAHEDVGSLAANTPRSRSDEHRRYAPNARRHEPTGASVTALVVSKLVWLTGTCLVFFVAWVLGPRLVEHYQYAATKARIQAEYDVAKVALKDAPLNQMSTAYRMVARRIRPSVVHISTFVDADRGRGGFPDGLPPGFEYFGPQGQGSGVIVSQDGYILTNEHVIRDAKSISVVLSDRRSYTAELIGTDKYTDLAVLKIEENDLIPAEWGDSDRLDVGSLVWAVGSPFGLEQSISFGIISAKHRKTNENPHQDLLQSDAAVNPGNSGGPLVDEAGRVVGINTSIVGETYQGISFSVPSSLAKIIFDKIVAEGSVRRGFLGVTPGLVTADEAERQRLNSLDGAAVRLVQDGSPADQCGLQVGDIITEWNETPITNDILLFRHVGMTPANSVAKLKYYRDGVVREAKVRIGTKEEEVIQDVQPRGFPPQYE